VRRRHRLASLVGVLALVVVLAPACGKKNQDKELVLNAIHATEAKAARFIYNEQRSGLYVDVEGIQEDDFRYKAEVSFNTQPAYDEVVNDDGIAMRIIDTSSLERLTDKNPPANLKTTTDVANLSVPDALRTHRWVVDGTGAPSPLDTLREPNDSDPVLDARTTLAYVEKAIGEAYSVKKYIPDALEPVYPSSEDKFPVPQKGSGVDRYDVVRPFLPAAATFGNTAGGQNALPSTKNFRKVAIYIKDGLVIRVMERTEVIGKQVSDVESYLRAVIRQQPDGSQVLADFNHLVSTTPEAKMSDTLLSVVDKLDALQGQSPVNARIMSFELVDTGKDLVIDLPADNVVHGSLLMLTPAGVKRAAKVGSSTSTAATASTSTSTTAAGSTGATTASSTP
jgi:hypothetical protein